MPFCSACQLKARQAASSLGAIFSSSFSVKNSLCYQLHTPYEARTAGEKTYRLVEEIEDLGSALPSSRVLTPCTLLFSTDTARRHGEWINSANDERQRTCMCGFLDHEARRSAVESPRHLVTLQHRCAICDMIVAGWHRQVRSCLIHRGHSHQAQVQLSNCHRLSPGRACTCNPLCSANSVQSEPSATRIQPGQPAFMQESVRLYV